MNEEPSLPRKEAVSIIIDGIADTWKKIALEIHAHPEPGRQEHFASDLLSGELHREGFSVQRGIGGLKTAFIAGAGDSTAKPVLAFLAEYDALPEIGHACGHHLIGPAACLAAIALSRAIFPGTASIRVIGCPDEEFYGGKARLLEKGFFQEVDAALMVHGFYLNVGMRPTIGRQSLIFEFFGKPAHASTVPFEGVNALDAVIQLFNSVSMLRQQMRPDARVHGIITHGGKAPNIIPEYTRAEFYVRSGDVHYLDELKTKVVNCARGAAQSTGAKLKVSSEGYPFLPLLPNRALETAYEQNLRLTGEAIDALPPNDGWGSSDFGNISRVIPALHGYMKVSEHEVRAHSREFAEVTRSEYALNAMVNGAKALAFTGLDLIEKGELLKKAREEFLLRKGNND